MSYDVSESIINIYELNKISEYLQDEYVTNVLVKLSSYLADTNSGSWGPPHQAIVKLESLAASFHMKGKYYMLIGKDEKNAAQKKNLYLSLAEDMSKIAAALKYSVK